MTQDKEVLEYMTRKLIEKYEKWGLELNKKKTRYMCLGGELEDLILNNNINIEACEEYMYLGVKIASKGRCEKEIEERIGKGRKVIGALNSVLWSRDISDHRKKLIYNAILKSVMLYGSEVWQLSEKHKKKLLSTELDFWRRLARISRLDRIRIERIREKMKVEGNIVQDIQEKQLQ
ncbi:uncharacterized protein LOC115880613 [Sitophilus oryzae]|uniref:Uncharacterized protein LOC115880613 n=1 Tax=Sitophilus oryzae TaxID=7048 RepID=A0A6J2XQG5_SITOR|nr:uncharacterized protein LOC115880613 [Sitophilus oryzae]